jgi:hypothetical protein
LVSLLLHQHERDVCLKTALLGSCSNFEILSTCRGGQLPMLQQFDQEQIDPYSNVHPHPTSAVPTRPTAHAHTAPPFAVAIAVNDGEPGILPAYVRTMQAQQPAPGPFSAQDLSWIKVKDKGEHAWAAAFAADRYPDFEQGENERDCCRLHCQTKDKNVGLLSNRKASCCYAADLKAARRVRLAAAPTDPPQPVREGTQARKGALQTGKSLHSDCQYRYTVKQYRKAVAYVIIKFPCGKDDTLQECMSLQHVTPAGKPAHSGDVRHLLQHCPDVEQIVLAKLRAATKASVIKEGRHSPILNGKLCHTARVAWHDAAILGLGLSPHDSG